MKDEKPPPPRRRVAAKPPPKGDPPRAAPAASGGQAFRLLNFEKPTGPIAKPPDQRIIKILEEWLVLARAGRFAVIGVVGVTEDGSMVESFIHTGSTIASLLTATELMKLGLLKALTTVYQAPPETILAPVPPANADPSEEEDD